MARPVGSKNKEKPVQTINIDGYAQAWTGAGTNRDRSAYTRARPSAMMDQMSLQILYTSDGFARRVVDVPAEEMTRAGIDIEDLDDALKDEVDAKLEELDAMRHMNDGLRWSRLFGGSVLIYGLNDGGTLDVPLNPDNIKDVEFLRVYDRYEATIDTRYTDASLPSYGLPEMWRISPQTGGSPYMVHESRLHMFDGEALPNFNRQLNLGWGASVLQSCYDQLTRLGMGHQWANMLLERAQQATHSIPGLTNLLRQPGGDALIQKRVDIVDMVRGILNTIVIDADEAYNVTSQSMTGVNELLDRFAEALAAVTGIPVFILMGRSPGGLSNSDTAGESAWYARIGSMQNDILKKPLDKLINWIIYSKTGHDGGDYQLKFNSLVVLSAKEKAEIEQLEANTKKLLSETDANYAGIGSFLPNEIRNARAEDYGIKENNDLTPEEIAAAVLEQAQVNTRVKVQ